MKDNGNFSLTSASSFLDALACVEQTEKISKLVPMGIITMLVGLPLLFWFVYSTFASAISNGLVMLVVAGLVIKLIEKLVLSPMCRIRYKGVARKLASAVQAVPETVLQWRSWWIGAPGALAVTQRGDVVIVDRSTNYDRLRLHPSQIVNVSVEREATQITNTKHSGRFTLGGVSGNGLFGGYTFGSRSKSTTHMIETAFLEVRYQLERNGTTYTTVIPFGNDRRGADALRATLTRLEYTG